MITYCNSMVINQIALYNVKTDSLLQHNIVQKNEKAKDLENYLKAIIQTYQQRMVKNDLTIP